MMIFIIIIVMSSSRSLSMSSSAAAAARSSGLFRSAHVNLHFGFATGAGLYEIANYNLTCQN
jgi:hypothetical protein